MPDDNPTLDRVKKKAEKKSVKIMRILQKSHNKNPEIEIPQADTQQCNMYVGARGCIEKLAKA